MMTCFVPRDIEPGFLTKDAFTTVMKSLSFLYSIFFMGIKPCRYPQGRLLQIHTAKHLGHTLVIA